MNQQHVTNWVANHPLEPIEVDCATTVMLKILDGKCKMNEDEKVVMALLYDSVKTFPGELFNTEMHLFIAIARIRSDEAFKNVIYEKRLLAETQLSRPIMKLFKAMLRKTGLLKPKDNPALEVEAA